jgi:NRPS condensation-like uncharacterized protein
VTTVPFSPLDEAIYHIEDALDPWNIQIEVGTTETIDVDRLRNAAVTACNAHPLARARRQPSTITDVEYVWQIPDDVGSVPVAVVDDDLTEARSAFYSRPFDLTREPPVRLLVARGAGREGGDRLLVCVSHVPADGVGAARITRSICQAYRGETADPDPVDLQTSRDALSDVRPSSLTGRMDVLGSAAKRLGDMVDSPTRIAADGATSGDGWGFTERTLSADQTERLVSNRPDGVSVNDVLLAGLHRAIADWNDDHGKPARKISIMMPVNLRPTEWFYDVVGMYALMEQIETRSRDRRDPRRTVETVADQTTAVKESDEIAALYEALEAIPPGVPVGLKGQLPHLLRGFGNRLMDTAVLSNLGRLPASPSLSDDEGDSLWFSPPCMKALPVGIGVATTGGTVRLVFRYTVEQFDADAAERFADCYLAHVEETTSALQ